MTIRSLIILLLIAGLGYWGYHHYQTKREQERAATKAIPTAVDEIDALRIKASGGDKEAQYELGERYFFGYEVQQDKTQAFNFYQMAADQHHADAIYALAYMTYSGDGVPQDKTQSVMLLKQVADQTNSQVHTILGFLYYFGEGVSTNKAAAFEWFEKAAEENSAEGQYCAAWLLYDGDGVPQDKVQAAAWLKKAAEQDHSKAQASLGVMLYKGDAVPQDREQGIYWLKKASSSGNGSAYDALHALIREDIKFDMNQKQPLYKVGDNVVLRLASGLTLKGKLASVTMTNAVVEGVTTSSCSVASLDLTARYQIDPLFREDYLDLQAADQVLEMFDDVGTNPVVETKNVMQDTLKTITEFADKGYAEAQKLLGLYYMNNTNTPNNYAQARAWFEKAAADHDIEAIASIGYLDYWGLGGAKSYGKAQESFSIASDNGDPDAQFYLGKMYLEGLGVPLNPSKALELLRLAADQDQDKAQFLLGKMYLKGRGVPEDHPRAYLWFRRSALLGNAEGQVQLGLFYLRGDSIPRNEKTGLNWINSASQMGYGPATRFLADYKKKQEVHEKAMEVVEEKAWQEIQRQAMVQKKFEGDTLVLVHSFMRRGKLKDNEKGNYQSSPVAGALWTANTVRNKEAPVWAQLERSNRQKAGAGSKSGGRFGYDAPRRSGSMSPYDYTAYSMMDRYDFGLSSPRMINAGAFEETISPYGR